MNVKNWQQTSMQNTAPAGSESKVETCIPPMGVNSRSKSIPDWATLARHANWSVKKLAKICGVSVRALERHFKLHAEKSPKDWLLEHRQKIAFELWRDGNSVKETAGLLGYQHAHSFSCQFEETRGFSPRDIVNQKNKEQIQTAEGRKGGRRRTILLHRVDNWPKLAADANWSVGGMAALCGVSTETLRQHFNTRLNMSPHAWLDEDRLQKAVEMLREGYSIKEIAICLGYRHQTNFSRKFKERWGTSPSEFIDACSRGSQFGKMINLLAK